jgi:methyl-accepting chemotaxis protein
MLVDRTKARSFLSGLSLKTQIISLAIAISMISIFTTVSIAYYKSQAAIWNMAEGQALAFASSTKTRLEGYFQRSEDNTHILAENRLVEGLFLVYDSLYHGAGLSVGKDEKLSLASYTPVDSTYQPKAQSLLKSYNLANLLLVTDKGQIIFSANSDREGIFAGRSLKNGALKDSKLAECFRQALSGKPGEVKFADYEYSAATGRTASFMCSSSIAEFDHSSDGVKKGDLLGVVVSEIAISYVNEITSNRDGQGETGQIYLVGPDRLLRSDFRLNSDQFNVNKSHSKSEKINSQSIDEALSKMAHGTSVSTDPTGYMVLSVYEPITVAGTNWALLSEKQLSEVLAPVKSILLFTFFAAGLLLLVIIPITIALISRLVKPLTSATNTLQNVSDSLSDDARELNHSAESLSSASQSQGTSLNQTMAAVEEVSSTISANSTNAKNSEDFSIVSFEKATRGREVVSEMIKSMHEIDKSSSEMMEQLEVANSQLTQIVGLIRNIEEKTRVINDIVFQTKLLSFNASVEAARAGEHGKGFSVVAEEVGNLARMSGQASEEIAAIVAEGVKRVEQTVSDTHQVIQRFSTVSREKVRSGTETAQRCGAVLEDIVSNVEMVTQMVQEISRSSAEQSKAMAEISSTMGSLSKVSDDTSQISEVSATSAEKLEQESETLKNVVHTLITTLKGAA